MADVGPGRYKLFTSAKIADAAGDEVFDLLPEGVALRGTYQTPKGELAVVLPLNREMLEDGSKDWGRWAKRKARKAALEKYAEG